MNSKNDGRVHYRQGKELKGPNEIGPHLLWRPIGSLERRKVP